ncbi:MAG TPA: HNH endonuclease [Isosphaeraceae bacterium]|jgi:hypothetical protein|nr:HNH endonuclease [Isosphaeraceae bacterium]
MSYRYQLPNPADVRAFWAATGLPRRKGLADPRELLDPRLCFACLDHMDAIERAHIEPRSQCMRDDVSNIHMLCITCHQDSEYLAGDAYWDWFWSRTRVARAQSFMMRHGVDVSALATLPAGRLAEAQELALSLPASLPALRRLSAEARDRR